MPPARTFCTHLNQGYLAKGLALHESLIRHHPTAHLVVLCLDDAAYDVLTRLDLERLEPVRHQAFADEAMRQARADRTEREYCYTCSASFPNWLLHTRPEIDLLTFLDADTYFYSDPEPLFDELGDGSVAITEHRFPDMWKHHEDSGVYNSGYACFRRDGAGLECAEWWHQRCLEWCHDWVEDDRFSDQKYLEQWPRLFDGVVVLQHAGANVAPWNVPRYRIHARDGQVMVDDQPLVFYHFCGVRKPAPGLWNSSVSTPMSRTLRKDVYGPYLASLHAWQQKVDEVRGTSLASKLRRVFPAPVATFRDLVAGEKLLLAPWGRVL